MKYANCKKRLLTFTYTGRFSQKIKSSVKTKKGLIFKYEYAESFHENLLVFINWYQKVDYASVKTLVFQP